MPLRAKLAGIPPALKSPADRPSCYLWFLSSHFSERDQGLIRAIHPSPLTHPGPFSRSRERLSPFRMPTSDDRVCCSKQLKTAWLQKSTCVLMFSQKQACSTSSSSRNRPWAKFPCQWCVKEVDSGESSRGTRKPVGGLYSRVCLISSQGLLDLQDQSVLVMDSTAAP